MYIKTDNIMSLTVPPGKYRHYPLSIYECVLE